VYFPREGAERKDLKFGAIDVERRRKGPDHQKDGGVREVYRVWTV